MFLAAAPYFASRFAGDAWIQANFQSGILTVATVTNLVGMVILTSIQHSASYPFRINLALVMNIFIFALLTASTAVLLAASPAAYFAFLLLMVGLSAWAAALIQNGAFAFAGSFRRPEYMQALMAGQGIAGVLPPVAQVVTVLVFPPAQRNPDETAPPAAESSAFFYFLAAVAISIFALVAFAPLVRRHNHIIENSIVDRMAESMTSVDEAERAARKVTSLWRLLGKLHWLAGGLVVTFAETMFFPVFTAKILSVHPPGSGILFTPAAFVPLGFFFWNLGDLGGRMATIATMSLKPRPTVLFVLSVARAVLLPLYFLCNIGGRGAVVSSDFFYLFVVQILYGLTNGWLGSSCMMSTGDWVEDGEREAAGSFMGLCLVVGLTVGSLLSFSVSGI